MTYIATFHVQGGVDELTSNYSRSEELRFELRSPRDIPAMLSAVDLARKLSLDHAGDPSNDRLTTVTLLELANSKGIVLDQKEVLRSSGLQTIKGSNWDDENRITYQSSFSDRLFAHVEYPEQPVKA